MRHFFTLSPLTRKRIDRFKSFKRGYYSLIIIAVFYSISLASELVANNKPILVRYEGKFYFPAVKFYPEKTFGGTLGTLADYKKLRQSPQFEKKGNFIVFPPIPYGPNESLLHIAGNPPTPPTGKNLMGTDDRGRDILTRLIYGFRVSVTFALILAVLGILNGTIIGGLQGFLGGYFDLTAQRLVEVLGMLPFLYLIILIGSIFGQGFVVLLIVYCIFNWIGLSYYMRAEFYRLRNFQFVEAARAMGIGNLKIIFRHILPNALTPIITMLPFMVITAIFSLSALDYLGFGLPPPTPSWGELMRQGLGNIKSYWISLFPFFILFITLLLFAFIGEALREAFDPKQYSKME